MVEPEQDTYGSVFMLLKNRLIFLPYCLQVWRQFLLRLVTTECYWLYYHYYFYCCYCFHYYYYYYYYFIVIIIIVIIIIIIVIIIITIIFIIIIIIIIIIIFIFIIVVNTVKNITRIIIRDIWRTVTSFKKNT